MPKENLGGWSLAEGFETSSSIETRDKERSYQCVDITHKLNCDTDLPPGERGETIITPETSTVLYNKALRRSDCPPVIIGMPHAGELVPKIIFDRTNRPDAFGGQGGLDTGTVSLFAPREDEFVGVRARISRIAVDTNRDPTDFDGKPPSNKGICWETDLVGQPIYKPGQELDLEEKKKLIQDFYTPYYQRLHALAGSLLDRQTTPDEQNNRQLLFIDGHSFPGDEDAPAYGVKASDPKPLILIGTGKGKTPIPGAEDRVVQALINELILLIPEDVLNETYLSKKVGLNEIWTGTKNIKYWGRKGDQAVDAMQRSQAIQIEVNRQFFMKDGKYDQTRLDMLHQALFAAIRAAAAAM